MDSHFYRIISYGTVTYPRNTSPHKPRNRVPKDQRYTFIHKTKEQSLQKKEERERKETTNLGNWNFSISQKHKNYKLPINSLLSNASIKHKKNPDLGFQLSLNLGIHHYLKLQSTLPWETKQSKNITDK